VPSTYFCEAERVIDDGRIRCWPIRDEVTRAYHDAEWGRPVRDEARLLEKICLEGFQSGLSWDTILRKRPGFRAAFAGFDPEALARYDEADVDRLVADARIVRNRRKIEAAITNARATADMRAAGETLADLVWAHRPPDRPAPRSWAEVAPSTPESTALARELKRRGFRFVGPTTVYAMMQAVGVVNDHLATCFVRDEIEALRSVE
jgi:DNA-3-methyladenine glycosylase I